MSETTPSMSFEAWSLIVGESSVIEHLDARESLGLCGMAVTEEVMAVIWGWGDVPSSWLTKQAELVWTHHLLQNIQNTMSNTYEGNARQFPTYDGVNDTDRAEHVVCGCGFPLT